jgi:hypothetical protein
VRRRRLQRPHPQKRRVPGAQPSKSKPEERFLSTQADRSRRANGKKKSACFVRNDGEKSNTENRRVGHPEKKADPSRSSG